MFEYHCERIGPVDLAWLDDWLNAMGADGWVLVTNEGGLYIFKRPKVTA